MSLRVTGLDEALSELEQMASAAPNAAGRASRASAERVAVAARQLVPVRTGTLRDSIRVDVGQDGMAAVEAGGPDIPYAEDVHEDLGAAHENGQAKFIEVPAMLEEQVFGEQLEAEISRLVEG